LHQNQFAYQAGTSTESALHNVTHIKRAVEHKTALGALFNVEKACDRTSFEAIASAARRHGLEHMLCRWTNSML